MKLLRTYNDLQQISASGSAVEFPLTNLQLIEPTKRWWADAYAGDVWIVVDRGAGAGTIDTCFLNGCNFPVCKLQGNATNSWTDPSFDDTVAPLKDRLGNRKGWFALESFTYRYFRLLIPAGQALDIGAAVVPALANLLLGASETLPTAGEIRARVLRPKVTQQFKSGRIRKTDQVGGRHVLTITLNDDWAAIRNFMLDWSVAAVSADLGFVSDSWLVYSPDDSDGAIRFVEDADELLILDELT